MAKTLPRPGTTTTLDFDHLVQHSVESLRRIEDMAKWERMGPRQAIFLAEEMVAHGHLGALPLIGQLQQHPGHAFRDYAMVLERCHRIVRERYRLEEVDRTRIVRAYRKSGYLLFEGDRNSRKLLVIFATIFNNFYISHLALHAMLKDIGCHLLILKDSSLANYQRGVAEFASDPAGIADKIQATARQLGAEKIYLSGFSSSGYPALWTSLVIPCDGYLGFSQATDLSLTSSLPLYWFFNEAVRARLDPRWLEDLRVRLEDADPAVPRVLYYGADWAKDVAHAEHLAGLSTIRLERLEGVGHGTVQHLLSEGRLIETFAQLIADR